MPSDQQAPLPVPTEAEYAVFTMNPFSEQQEVIRVGSLEDAIEWIEWAEGRQSYQNPVIMQRTVTPWQPVPAEEET